MSTERSAIQRRVPLDSARCRLRTSPDGRLEAQLARAADLGRRSAIERTSRRFCGTLFEDLTRNLDAKTPQVVRVDPDFLAGLDVLDSVDRCLMTMDARPGHLRFADGSRRSEIPELEQHVVPGEGDAGVHSLRPFGAYEAMCDGATLISNNVVPRMDGELRALADDLSRSFGVPVQVNLYMSEREAPGFGRHWDDHDVLVIQGHGRKHWTLYEPIALSPRIGFTPTRSFGKEVFSTVLEEGLALYVPRGWGHEVRGFGGEVSLHYTIGLRFQTMVDVIEEVRWMRSHSDRERCIDGNSEREQLDLRLDRAMLEHVVGSFRSKFVSIGGLGPMRISEALQASFSGIECKAPFPGGLVFLDSEAVPDGCVGFAAGGVGFYSEPGEVDALAMLLSGGSLRIEPGSLYERSRALVLALARTGVVRFEVAK